MGYLATAKIKSSDHIVNLASPANLPLLDAVRRESLPDTLARAVRRLIDREGLEPGQRLPAIQEMARQFEVGAPTLREALRLLQAVGVVDIRHGSGVYVADGSDALFFSKPTFDRSPTQQTMIDLIETRLAVETLTARLAARNVTDSQLDELADLLAKASASVDGTHDEDLLHFNMSFHRRIAAASGNKVALKVLEVLSGLFHAEQYAILALHESRAKDHREHVGIYEAIRARNESLAVRRMRAHLEGVRRILEIQDADSIEEALERRGPRRP